jgi:hypothetical protein
VPTLAKSTNLAVRCLLELRALGALGYWGFVVGGNLITKVVLGLAAPLPAAVVWGLFVGPKAAVPLDMPLRLVPEALVFGAAVAALLATGHLVLAVRPAVLAAVNRALVLAWE